MLFQTSARTMLSAEYTVTGDDVTAYFDYVCRRARRSALLLGGGFGLLIALTTGLVLVWLSGEPVVGAIGGTIPGALIIGNALRDLSRDALRRELARWNVLESIPQGPQTISIDERGATLTWHAGQMSAARSGIHSVWSDSSGALTWPATEIVTTAKHAFLLQFIPHATVHHAWVIPLHAMSPADCAALRSELDTLRRAKKK